MYIHIHTYIHMIHEAGWDPLAELAEAEEAVFAKDRLLVLSGS